MPSNESKDETKELTWMHVFVRVGLNAVTHPIEYAKILIQLGHEPMAPYKSRTIFGREMMYYPSIFSYMAFIKHRDGFAGCYRGLSSKLIGNVVSGIAFQEATKRIKANTTGESSKDEMENDKVRKFVEKTMIESVGRIAAITASQPFHVIAVRTMAEFVGEDLKYTGVITSIKIIYQEEGIGGFFSGIVPRILCDIGALWLANSAIYFVNNHLVEDSDIKSYISASMRFLASAIMYPLQVVANCMAVNGSNLVATTPPNMPLYNGWYDCYLHLRRIKCTKRGSSLLWRAYYGYESLSSQEMYLEKS